MATTTISARICVRRDTTANWNAHPTFVPLKGEVIVYTDHGTIRDENNNLVYVPAMKVGDGNAYLVDLPFLNEDQVQAVIDRLTAHEANTVVHTNADEKSSWNHKERCYVSGNTLIFTTN